jgi:hypothetical protein
MMVRRLSVPERIFGMGIVRQAKSIDYMVYRKKYPKL